MHGFFIAQLVFIFIQLILLGILIYKGKTNALTEEWRKAITTGNLTCCGIVWLLCILSMLF